MAELILIDITSGFKVMSAYNENNRRLEEFFNGVYQVDGSAPVTSDLNMQDTFKVINLANPTASTDGVSLGYMLAYSAGGTVTGTAMNVAITDTAGYYTSSNVEGALAELGALKNSVIPKSTLTDNTVLCAQTAGTPIAVSLGANQFLGTDGSGVIQGIDISTLTNFTPSFLSTEADNVVLAQNSTITLKSGIASMPKFVNYFLKCKETNVGYSVGDRVAVDPVLYDTDGICCVSTMVVDDGGTYSIKAKTHATSGRQPYIINPTTNVAGEITFSKWYMFVHVIY
jgi:hypothetical protein